MLHCCKCQDASGVFVTRRGARQHIHEMTEIFEELAVIGDPVKEDRVVHLLASSPKCYNMLITSLVANSDVPPTIQCPTVSTTTVHLLNCSGVNNPWRACAARVTVLGLCVSPSVCRSPLVLALQAPNRLMSDTKCSKICMAISLNRRHSG